MKSRWIALMAATAGVVVWLAPLSAAAQSGTAATTWRMPRTPDGQPDLQGAWTFKTLTPLERPAALADKEFLTPEEAAVYEQQEIVRQSRDRIDPAKGGAGIYPPGGVVPYNDFWYDHGTNVVGSRRTSLIIDPRDGRLPPMTADGQKRAEAEAAFRRDEQLGRAHADDPEQRSVGDRCIMGFNAGPPILPGAYNQNLRIVQSRDHFVILNEMVHNARVIPLDARPHLPMPQWSGSSRGRWEGDTLVIETRNFYFKTSMSGSTPRTTLVERLTRIDEKTINYEITVTDPTTWTKPWTALVPFTSIQEDIYEYACHEGNVSMVNVLRGARLQEEASARAGSR